jgi:hypothetical protein
MKSFALFVLIALSAPALPAATMSHGAALGTSAALDADGRLWIVQTEPAGEKAHVVVKRSDDRGATWPSYVRVTATPEPVAADGENRPKLAFGTGEEIYVSWTSPTSEKFTGDIRFARSLDGGRSWSAPSVVHRDRQLITHRFESLLVDRTGRIWVAWIDKRDLSIAQAAGNEYTGAAIYYAYSDDRGANWHGDYKLADHSCECCRIALTTDAQGRAVAMWRHVFAESERDHAIAVLSADDDSAAKVERVTFDRWKIDACPHHGPSLAVTADGTRHAVWFNQVNGEGGAFYGRLGAEGPSNVQALPAGATHADLATAGNTIAVAWKRFDGEVTRVETLVSTDNGKHFAPGPVLTTTGDSDQPRLTSNADAVVLVWQRAEGLAVQELSGAPRGADIRPFNRDTMRKLEQTHAGSPFWVVLWDLECVYCMKSLGNLATVQRSHPDLKVITIATDRLTAEDAIRERLAQLGVKSDAYAFATGSDEALRFTVDPAWMGEKPRAYRYAVNGSREAVSGVVSVEQFTSP